MLCVMGCQGDMTMTVRKICVVKSQGAIAPHIMQDIADALVERGHEVMVLDIRLAAGQRAMATDRIEAIIADLRAFAPDFALSYASAGCIDIVSPSGGTVNLFEVLNLRYALLFFDAPLDHPEYLGKYAQSQLMTVFCWDASFMPWIRSLAIERVFYLPLAVNPKRFVQAVRREPIWPVSFVGSLGRIAHSECTDALKAVQVRYLQLKAAAPVRPFDELLAEAESGVAPQDEASYQRFKQSPAFVRFLFATLRQGDHAYRRAAVETLLGRGIVVFGNSEWQTAGLPGLTCREPVEYGSALADVYAASLINLNVTNSHLRNAVNQRVFDVPAAGGFVLTDYRKELDVLFEPDREMACFHTLDELQSQVDRYTADVRARETLINRARRRVLSEHTWTYRVNRLVSCMEAG